VSGIEAADAAREVDEAIAIDIFDDRAFRLRDENGRGVIGSLHDGSITALHQGLRTRAGNGSA
jgi:hypothetical protein